MNELNRRQFLYGAGVSMLLPQLESFGASTIAKPASPPKRFLALYAGHGFAVTPNDEHTNSDLSWYPKAIEDKLKFGPSMVAMQPFRRRERYRFSGDWTTRRSQASTGILRPTLF